MVRWRTRAGRGSDEAPPGFAGVYCYCRAPVIVALQVAINDLRLNLELVRGPQGALAGRQDPKNNSKQEWQRNARYSIAACDAAYSAFPKAATTNPKNVPFSVFYCSILRGRRKNRLPEPTNFMPIPLLLRWDSRRARGPQLRLWAALHHIRLVWNVVAALCAAADADASRRLLALSCQTRGHWMLVGMWQFVFRRRRRSWKSSDSPFESATSMRSDDGIALANGTCDALLTTWLWAAQGNN